ncbi:stage II sporulation protein D [Paenibacillus sp. y28]|uniref:stage II sporulation protein D n=1 Tax=Paenibacillus sp. y28 TaxID=3129110 RepID=UPI003018D13A
MKMRLRTRKPLLWGHAGLSMLAFLAVLIPGILAMQRAESHPIPDPAVTRETASSELFPVQEEAKPFLISVYLTGSSQVEQVPLETYVRGVLAAEMPVEFEPEALKAQALAARTYIIRRLWEQDSSGMPEQAGQAQVTDSITHQAYLSQKQLASKWKGPAAEANMEKLNKAVQETAGQIITYENKPINATFFSTSNGYTENSEEYWGIYVPYLRSVASPWDVSESPKYKATQRMSQAEMLRKLQQGTAVPVVKSGSGTVSAITVLARTAGHRIKTIRAAGQLYSGKDFRERLGLNSSQFTWRLIGKEIEFTTYGYGHGVGMSQWGANGMARAGSTAEQIVRYYYSGVQIERVEPFL